MEIIQHFCWSINQFFDPTCWNHSGPFFESHPIPAEEELNPCGPVVTPNTAAMEFPTLSVKHFQPDTAENTIRDRDGTALSAASSVYRFILLYCSSCFTLPEK